MRDPVAVWQKHLEQYVSEQGNDDPNILRDTVDMHSRRNLRPALITFGGRFKGPGIPPFRDDRDINGVLLGQREIGARNWYLFLVGFKSRNNRFIEDVRLVGFTSDQTRLQWRVADPDPEAVKRYLAAVQNDSRGSTSGEAKLVTFPSPLDEYSLEVYGYAVSVTEKRSGAVWELDLKD